MGNTTSHEKMQLYCVPMWIQQHILTFVEPTELSPYDIRAVCTKVKEWYEKPDIWELLLRIYFLVEDETISKLTTAELRDLLNERIRVPVLDWLTDNAPRSCKCMEFMQNFKVLNLTCLLPGVQSLPDSFKQLRLTKLMMGNTPLVGAEETYTVLSQIPTLTELDLSCSDITSLPQGFWQLNIKGLNLNSCKQLDMDSILEKIALNFKNIERLDIRSTNVTVLTEGFKQLRLTKLTLGQTSLDGAEETYTALSQIPTLTELDLSCSDITTLPQAIGGCTSLKTLDLCETTIKELPEGIGNCTALQTLDCHDCYELQSLPPSFKQLRLTKLVLGNTPLDGAEETYAVLSQIPTLTELDLSGMELESLPNSIGWLKSLTTLNLERTEIEELPEGVGNCTALRELILKLCTELESLPSSIGGCIALQYLDLGYCRALESLPNTIGELKSLEELDLHDTNLESLPEGIGGCTALQVLNLGCCEELESLPNSLWQLDIKDLDLYCCESLDMDSTLEMIALNFKNIEKLNITATNVTVLTEGIGNCTALQTLNCFECISLQSLPPSIGGCIALQELDLCWCRALESLPNSVGGCTALRELCLGFCTALKSLPEGIGNCTALRTLNCHGCTSLQSLPPTIGGCTSLKTLDLRGTAINELPEGVGNCTALRKLNLHFCPESLPEGDHSA